MWGAYKLVWLKEGDEHKLAFQTRYALFQSTIPQFGTTHAPADFHRYIINGIREVLDDCVSTYLDDVLVYSDSKDDHVGHVECIMQRLLEAAWYLKPQKCKFHMETIRYLAVIISTQGISRDEDIVETVQNWSWEKKSQNGWLNPFFQVQQLLGFCNYYQPCIPNYSEKVEPLTWLTKKDGQFVWEAEQHQAFEIIIFAFTTALAFHHFEHEREVIIETDGSDYVSAGVLLQQHDEGVLLSVAYFSKHHTPAECDYDIYDKELMVMIHALQGWKSECEGVVYSLKLIPHHKNLKNCLMKKHLNWRPV